MKMENVHKLMTAVGTTNQEISISSITTLFYRPSTCVKCDLDNLPSLQRSLPKKPVWTFKRRERTKGSASPLVVSTPPKTTPLSPAPNSPDVLPLVEWDNKKKELWELLLIQKLRDQMPSVVTERSCSLKISDTITNVEVVRPHIPMSPKARTWKHRGDLQRSYSSPLFRKVQKPMPHVTTAGKTAVAMQGQLYAPPTDIFDPFREKHCRKCIKEKCVMNHEEAIRFLEKKHPLHDLFSITFDGSGILLLTLFFYLRSKSYFLVLQTLAELHHLQPTHSLFGSHGGYLLGLPEEKKVARGQNTSKSQPDLGCGDAVEALFAILGVTKEGLPDELLTVPYLHSRLMEYLERFYKQGMD